MKIRAITYGLHIRAEDLRSVGVLKEKLTQACSSLQVIEDALQNERYTVQTKRIAFNSFEEWMIPLIRDGDYKVEDLVHIIDSILSELDISFCSIGYCKSELGSSLIPIILKQSSRLSASYAVTTYKDGNQLPSIESCEIAARTCLDVAKMCGDLGNFRFCASFRSVPNTPFFPVAYHEGEKSSISVGLENGDLIFLAAFGQRNHQLASNNLLNILEQTLEPIEKVVARQCEQLNLDYAGIDASINPGLSLPDSIGNGLELLLPRKGDKFGMPGTIATVATVTSALKAIKSVKLCGYSGLMLPVMEDLILAARAKESPPTFSLRDLLVCSTICGVGIDTVPIPGQTTVEELVGVYMDTGALASRLCKPLTCRFLPMNGLAAGEETNVDSPFLCNTKVFQVN